MNITWIDTPIGLRVAETPITQAQWVKVMGTGTTPEGLWQVEGDDYPATHVTWDEAKAFADKVGGRLPTSEEFLALALAGQEAMTEPITDYAVCEQDEIAAVRTKLPNQWGLYDMAGLVWEWCSDGPDERRRYQRGGSWYSHHGSPRAVSRFGYVPRARGDALGFRVVVWCGPPSQVECEESTVEEMSTRFTAIPTGPSHKNQYYLAQNGVVGWTITPEPIITAVEANYSLADWMNDAETRIAELEAQLDAARADLARYVAGIDEQREAGRAVLTRLIQLVEEWERAECTAHTHECAEQVRGILRGEGARLQADDDAEKARLLMVAIDEAITCNPHSLERIVVLLRDPARNPWASLMRAGKEGGEK